MGKPSGGAGAWGETFRQELLAQLNGRMGEHHYGLERAESVEETDARIVREKLARAGWTENCLSGPKAIP